MIPIQSAGITDPSLLGFALLAFLAGMAVPTRYGLERLAGFARWFVAKLPYEPPPGKDRGEALEDATDGQDSPGSTAGAGSEESQ